MQFKMWISMLPLMLVLQGAFGDFRSCKMEKCYGKELKETFNDQTSFPPSAEVLKFICPHALDAAKCATRRIVECTGMDFQELAASGIEPDSTYSKAVNTVVNLIKELCTEGTSLNKGYVENISCVREYVTTVRASKVSKCRTEAVAAYTEFLKRASEANGDMETEERKKCGSDAYVLGCELANVKKNCGDVAFNTSVSIIRELKSTTTFVCEDDDIRELKATFLKDLKLEDEVRGIYAIAFDLKSG